MSTAAPPPAPKPAPAAPPGPPDEAFWDKYSAHAEFPISTVATVFIHVAIGAILIVILTQLMNHGDNKSSVPIKLVDVTGGPDDAGDGSAGSGGISDSLAKDNSNPLTAKQEALPDPKMLPRVVEEIKKEIKLEDPNANVPISAENAAAFAMTDKKLRDKLLGLGKKGAGDGDGSGDSGQKGAGPGGSGADSTRARTMRWVLRFRTASGADYLEQLGVMGAVVIVPVPPDEERCLLFRDLRNPGPGVTATEGDLKGLSRQIKFSDTRVASVGGVANALKLSFAPKSFWAFFPKTLEEELARKETGFRNRRSEDIDETVFQVTIRDGRPEILVYDQTAKR